MIVKRLKHPLSKLRNWLYEALVPSQPTCTRAALDDLDSKLEKYLNYDNGFFIEAGANDGFFASNTYYFEMTRHWRGILIEPIPELYRRCRKLRKNSKVINCALVSNTYSGKHVTMRYANLMSIVDGARGDAQKDSAYIQQGLEVQDIKRSYSVRVPGRTLTSILDELAVTNIDLLTVDVEGYEVEALKGLDLQRYRPKYICVEAWARQAIDDYLIPYYEIVDELTELDILYRAK